MAWRIVRGRRWTNGATLGTDHANAVDFVAAHRYQRRPFVVAEWAMAEIDDGHPNSLANRRAGDALDASRVTHNKPRRSGAVVKRMLVTACGVKIRDRQGRGREGRGWRVRERIQQSHRP